MLAKRIIPCLDIDRGRVVKGINFLSLVDAGDPVEQAQKYDREGADELVFLDITASSDARKTMLEMVNAVANAIFIPFTVGGGIRTIEDIRETLLAGADKISLNTAAVANPELIAQAAQRFGSQCIVVAIDARRVVEPAANPNAANDPNSPHTLEANLNLPAKWQVYTHGGRKATGIDAIEWAQKVAALGAGEILLTSMDADGTKDGYDLALTRSVAQAVKIPVIASGGAGEMVHLYQAFTEGEAAAVLAASIFHFGTFTIGAVKEYLNTQGVPVRQLK